MKQVPWLALALSFTLTACGNAGFGGSTGKKGSDNVAQDSGPSTEAGQNNVASPGDGNSQAGNGAGDSGINGNGNGEGSGDTGITVDGGDSGILGNSSDKEAHKSAIKKCLKLWGNSPFSEGSAYRTIYASVSIGSGGAAIKDHEKTEEPALILIVAGVNVFGKPKYELHNPNGWYCMVANVNVLTDLTVELHENAKLADSKVQVDVGSTSDSTSAVGVNVGSNVKVVRVN